MDGKSCIEFPFEIRNVDPEVLKQRQKHFTGAISQYVRVGPKGYFLHADYKKEAAEIYTMPLRNTDVFILGYPRSGTTWTQELVWMIVNDLDYSKSNTVSLRERYQYLDRFGITVSVTSEDRHEEVNPRGTSEFAAAPDPRFVKTHLPLSLLPPILLDTARVVYVARDPRDVAVSYYHLCHVLKSHKFVGDFKTYWQYFTNDLESRTPYFEHLKEAWQNRHHPRMLFLFYEEISKDLSATLKRVAKFFNKQYTDKQLAGLCEHLSFKNFKNNKSVNIEHIKRIVVDIAEDNHFIRKGTVGGWRDFFDEEMTQQAHKWIQDNLRDTDLVFPTQ